MVVEPGVLPERYRDPKRIGRGGMGDVYRATDEVLGRTVVVKVLSERYTGDVGIRERFKREGLAAARLSGRPSVVTVFDVGEWAKRPYIVMEHLGGGSLEDRLLEGRPPLSQALTWLEQAAHAVDAAHEQGVVHRDLKPGNLLLDADANVHVADFGIASATGMDSLTKTGMVLGTAAYLSPEQALGSRATPASDRYALAVVAFELLADERPFTGDTAAAEAAAHVHAKIPAISSARPDLPRALDAVFRRALAKEPDERYPTAAEFVADLRHALQSSAGETRALGAPVLRRARSATRRWAAPIVVVLALVGAGLVLAAVLAANGDGDGDAVTPTTVVRTVTQQGRTERVTVTAQPATEPAPPAQGLSVAQARALQDESSAALQAQDWERALALAQQALPALEGRDRTYEGYANYNIGRALAELGRCEEALPYLQRREELGGPHPDVTAAKAKCGA